MVTRTFHTPEGITTRKLTDEEVNNFAAQGDYDCKLEIAKKENESATTEGDRIAVIEKLLEIV